MTRGAAARQGCREKPNTYDIIAGPYSPGSDKSGKLANLACDEQGMLYKGAQILILDPLASGTAKIIKEPKVGEMFNENNNWEVQWEHGIGGHVNHQLHIRFVPVDGVCPALVRQ